MAVYSMTGYGSGTLGADPTASNVTSLTVEVRSVNGRFLDLTIKAPDEARGVESALRELVTRRIKRGKVELRVSMRHDDDGGALTAPSPERLAQLAQVEATVRSQFAMAAPLSVNEILMWCRQGSPVERRDDQVLQAATTALDGLIESRAREGARLADSLRKNGAIVRELARQAAPLVGAVVERQQVRFLERWRDALAAAGAGASTEVPAAAAQERALTEAAAYAMRIDVAEELTRLDSHLDELTALLDKGGELGKRLDFLVQEMHREANTLGAKSQALELTNLSMSMKVAIEQMREQVQNIE